MLLITVTLTALATILILLILYKRQLEGFETRRYRLLVSAQCSPYQDWQSVGVYWTAKERWPQAGFTRLLSCETANNYIDLLPSFVCSDWGKHPKSGDEYLPYNRPRAITEYLQSVIPEEEYLVIVDPDIIICKPLTDLPVQRGIPVAQKYDYLHNDDALNKLAQRFLGTTKNVQPLGMPMVIHRDDLRQLAPLWLELTEKIRDDPETKEIAGWIAEMHSYCLASAQLGLVHKVRDDLADRVPYDRVSSPYVLHYDLEHHEKEFNWNKRDYLVIDMINSTDLMPVPQKGNKYFKQVFEDLNNSLHFIRGK